MGKADLSALEALDNLSMESLLGDTSSANESIKGKPLEIPLDDITEDPEQPRKSFDEDSLKELAASISSLGVLMPIAVRPRSDGQPGYMIIAGARRYRASRLAGLQSIPAFVQDATDNNRYVQMAENIHRDNLGLLEIASFIADELAQGKKQTEIARQLSKDKSYVSRFVALAAAPDWIKNLVFTGRCNDIRVLASIIKRSEKESDLESKFADVPEITKATLSTLDTAAAEPPAAPQVEQQSPATSAMPYTMPEDFAQDTGAEQGSREPEQPEAVILAEVPAEDYKEPKAPKEQSPSFDLAVYVAGRKGYVQNKKFKIYFEDADEMAEVSVEDVSFTF